jgi:hypothetical protein
MPDGMDFGMIKLLIWFDKLPVITGLGRDAGAPMKVPAPGGEM